ncbi:ABC transporter ATP-binding protein [Cumulibacter manganitolerans]|uniref:ABC transporter ATP-binding protein n=1 Tax=Cumulibacter manganitolerans TaxID=1884992 RepID=UPI001297B671|nr:ABC transporter ATP-binding protein [Cumulibacter manganitolerans]
MSPVSTAATAVPPVLAVDDLQVRFSLGRGRTLRAVDGVSFDLAAGSTLGIIGESGSGKSTLARAIMGLAPIAGGRVTAGGAPVPSGGGRTARGARRAVQMVFQDPTEALDPRLAVEASIAEPLLVNRIAKGRRARTKVAELLDRVGLTEQQGRRRPRDLSGGQRQRVNIARALALDPRVLICDEAVSALDVSIQADILNLLMDLQQESGIAYLFISHDIGVVSRICDRIGVMYLGQLVESGTTRQVTGTPRHPYTEALLSAEPVPLPRSMRTDRRIVLRGELPSPLNPPSGCRFRTRCRFATDLCEQVPQVHNFADGHRSRCHFADELTLVGGHLSSLTNGENG